MQFLLKCLNIFFLPVDNPQILEENEPFWEKFASVADPNPDPGFLVGSGSGSVFLDPDPDPPISVIFPIFLP